MQGYIIPKDTAVKYVTDEASARRARMVAPNHEKIIVFLDPIYAVGYDLRFVRDALVLVYAKDIPVKE